MRITAWNCNMQFRNKYKYIKHLNYDIGVISECESLDKILKASSDIDYKYAIWIGDNPNKGLGIFSFSDINLKLAQWYCSDFKYIVPVFLEKNNERTILLFAVWACNPKTSKYRYIEQVFQSINYYSRFISNENIIMIGDFNSKKIWDKEHLKNGSHSMVVDFLKAKKIQSSYHLFYNETEEKESIPTFFLQKNINKKYHIDYCFISDNLYSGLSDMQIGNSKFYLQYSDHMPITVDFKV